MAERGARDSEAGFGIEDTLASTMRGPSAAVAAAVIVPSAPRVRTKATQYNIPQSPDFDYPDVSSILGTKTLQLQRHYLVSRVGQPDSWVRERDLLSRWEKKNGAKTVSYAESSKALSLTEATPTTSEVKAPEMPLAPKAAPEPLTPDQLPIKSQASTFKTTLGNSISSMTLPAPSATSTSAALLSTATTPHPASHTD